MNTSDSQAVNASAPASSIVATLGSIYPVILKKVKGKEYIKVLEMHLYDLINVYTSPEKLEFLKNRKFSEIRTPNGNVRIIFMFHYKDDDYYKIALTVSYNTRNTYQAPTNSAIISHYNIYRKQYTINTDAPESPNKDENKLLNYVRNELKEIAKLEDNPFMWYFENDETFELIYLNKKLEYYYNDEEEQNEKIEEEKEAHINLRRKIKINDILNVLNDSIAPLHNDIYIKIHHNLRNFDIPYKKYDNKILNLLSISHAILYNQMERGNAKPSLLLWPNNYYYDGPVRDIHIYNMNNDNINDEDAEEKINMYHNFLNSYNICFRDYNNKSGMYTGIYDIIDRLITLIYVYLEDIINDYDQSPNECVILNMISFYNEHLFNIVDFFIQKQLIENNNIKDIHIMNDQHQYIFNLMVFNDLEGGLMPEYYFNRLIKDNIPEIKIIRRPRHSTQYIYKGCLLMTRLPDFYAIRYKEYKRINLRIRDVYINKIINLIHEKNAGRIFFDRQ